MTRSFCSNTIVALCLAISTHAFAAEAKPKPGATGTPQPPKTAASPAATPVKTRALPMYARVDSIDTANKTFITKRKKDGVEIKHILPATAEVKQGNASAKFSEIKVGDWVAGSRIKKSDTEYEIVKITKFGPRAEKEDKPDTKDKKE